MIATERSDKMRQFTWCRQELAEDCRHEGVHAHIVITSVGYRMIVPSCKNTKLTLFFWDLDPAAIRRTAKYKKDPALGDRLIDGCFSREQAAAITMFVGATAPDDIVVNCEGGISRSAGIVLALRRAFGGDTEQVFNEAHPNIHVASLLGEELGVGPFLPRLPAVVENFFAADDATPARGAECDDRVWVTSPGTDCWKCNLPPLHDADHKSTMDGVNIAGGIEKVRITITWAHAAGKPPVPA